MHRSDNGPGTFMQVDMFDPDLLMPTATESFEAVDLGKEQLL